MQRIKEYNAEDNQHCANYDALPAYFQMHKAMGLTKWWSFLSRRREGGKRIRIAE